MEGSPPLTTYKIGTNFCLEYNTSVESRTMVNLRCDIGNLDRNLATNTPQVFPRNVPITWKKNGVTYYSNQTGTVVTDIVISPDFIMANPLLISGNQRLEDPQALMPSQESDDSLCFNSRFTLRNLTLIVLPPGTTPETARRMIFESLLGTWTCTAANSLGNETCTSTIRECGGC